MRKLFLLGFLILLLPLSIFGLISPNTLAQGPAPVTEPPIPTINNEEIPGIPIPPQAKSNSSISTSSSSWQLSNPSPTVPVVPTDSQSGNNSVNFSEVNPGDSTPRSGGGQILFLLIMASIIGYGYYFYHKNIRDKSQFKIDGQKIK